MMNAEAIIFNYIVKKKKMYFDRKKIEKGIVNYVTDNGLNALCEGMNDIQKSRLIEDFIEPIFSSNEEARVYFENYDLLVRLKLLSNELFDAAEKRYNGYHESDNIDYFKEELSRIIEETYRDDSLSRAIEMEVSECLLDINYIMGLSDKISFRLSRKVKR